LPACRSTLVLGLALLAAVISARVAAAQQFEPGAPWVARYAVSVVEAANTADWEAHQSYECGFDAAGRETVELAPSTGSAPLLAWSDGSTTSFEAAQSTLDAAIRSPATVTREATLTRHPPAEGQQCTTVPPPDCGTHTVGLGLAFPPAIMTGAVRLTASYPRPSNPFKGCPAFGGFPDVELAPAIAGPGVLGPLAPRINDLTGTATGIASSQFGFWTSRWTASARVRMSRGVVSPLVGMTNDPKALALQDGAIRPTLTCGAGGPRCRGMLDVVISATYGSARIGCEVCLVAAPRTVGATTPVLGRARVSIGAGGRRTVRIALAHTRGRRARALDKVHVDLVLRVGIASRRLTYAVARARLAAR
jgi:hypothetical protein